MSDFSPYQSPRSDLSAPRDLFPQRRPGVVFWFYVYCGVMVALYMLVCVLGIGLLVLDVEAFGPPPDADPMAALQMQIVGVVYAVMGALFTIPFALAFLLPPRPWVWVYAIILICFGLMSCCFWPSNIPMLLYWIKPETKAWFRRDS
jgi:hypothetical protein